MFSFDLSQMFNFKALVTTALFTVPFLGAIAPQKADAASSYCYQTTSNATVCIHSVHSHKTLGNAKKRVVWSVNGGSLKKTIVTCTSAHRYNYREDLAGIACFQFS